MGLVMGHRDAIEEVSPMFAAMRGRDVGAKRGRTSASFAAVIGCSPRIGYKWRARCQQETEAGLAGASPRDASVVYQILVISRSIVIATPGQPPARAGVPGGSNLVPTRSLSSGLLRRLRSSQ